jgi:hypothetical protein
MSEKWTAFEEGLSFTILQAIARSVRPKYWTKLRTVLRHNSKNATFLRSIDLIEP